MNLKLVFGLFFAAVVSISARADWYLYETRNFAVYSQESTGRAREMAQELEQYRTYLVQALQVKIDMPDQLPLSVYVAKNKKAFLDLTGAEGAAGLFTNSMFGPTAVFHDEKVRSGGNSLVESFGQKNTQVMLHEYVHHLMRQQSTPVFYPLWYSEGMAEFLSNYHLRDGNAVLGDLLLARMPGLARKQFWLDMEELLNASQAVKPGGPMAQGDTFYGQGWLLTRLMFTDADFQGNIGKFVRDLSLGVSAEKALKDNYGMTFSDLDKKFRKNYRDLANAMKRGKDIMLISMPMPKAQIETFAKGKLSATESEWITQMVTFLFRHSDEDHREQAENGQKAYSQTGDTRFKQLSVLARRDTDQWDQAWSEIKAALSENPSDPILNRAAGQLLVDRELAELDKEEGGRDLNRDNVKLARDYLKIAVMADDWDALARMYLAYTFIIGDIGEFQQAAPYIRDAYALYPQYFPVTQNYLDLLLFEKRYVAACRLIRPLYHLSAADNYRADMQKRLEQIPDQQTACPV